MTDLYLTQERIDAENRVELRLKPTTAGTAGVSDITIDLTFLAPLLPPATRINLRCGDSVLELRNCDEAWNGFSESGSRSMNLSSLLAPKRTLLPRLPPPPQRQLVNEQQRANAALVHPSPLGNVTPAVTTTTTTTKSRKRRRDDLPQATQATAAARPMMMLYATTSGTNSNTLNTVDLTTTATPATLLSPYASGHPTPEKNNNTTQPTPGQWRGSPYIVPETVEESPSAAPAKKKRKVVPRAQQAQAVASSSSSSPARTVLPQNRDVPSNTSTTSSRAATPRDVMAPYFGPVPNYNLNLLPGIIGLGIPSTSFGYYDVQESLPSVPPSHVIVPSMPSTHPPASGPGWKGKGREIVHIGPGLHDVTQLAGRPWPPMPPTNTTPIYVPNYPVTPQASVASPYYAPSHGSSNLNTPRTLVDPFSPLAADDVSPYIQTYYTGALNTPDSDLTIRPDTEEQLTTTTTPSGGGKRRRVGGSREQDKRTKKRKVDAQAVGRLNPYEQVVFFD